MFSTLYRDYWLLYFLILITIIASYFTSNIVGSIIYLGILISFYKSKEDIIYLALVLTIIAQPGFLYYDQTEKIISISLLKFSFIELFSLVSLIKYFRFFKKKKLIIFQKEYLIYILSFIFFIIYGLQYGMVISGTNSSGLGLIRRIIKVFFLLPLFVTIPYMLRTKLIFYKFIYLIFSLAIFNFITQLIVMMFGGTSLHALLHGAMPVFENEGSRPVYGMYIGFLAFVFSIYLSLNKNKYNSSQIRYFNTITGISFFSVVLSATRGWLIAYVVILLLTFLFNIKGGLLGVVKWTIPIFIVGFFILKIPFIKTQIDFAISRFETLELLYEGDLTAGGTNSRLTDRSDPVIAEFEKSPLFGWGISAKSAEYYDVHVGNQSMLMTSGFIGYIIMLIFLISVNLKILRYRQSLKILCSQSRNLIFFSFVFAGLFIIHSSSTDLFGFMVFTYGGHVSKVVLHAIFFGVITMFINFSIEEYNDNAMRVVNNS